MVLLTVPFDPDRRRRAERLPTAGMLAVLGCLVVLCAGLAIAFSGNAISNLGRGMASGAVHGTFLLAGWMIAGRQLVCLTPVIHAAVVVCVASVATVASAWGALLYLAPPVILLAGGTRHLALRNIGLTLSAGVRNIALGLA